jgi:hypothetical protein
MLKTSYRTYNTVAVRIILFTYSIFKYRIPFKFKYPYAYILNKIKIAGLPSVLRSRWILAQIRLLKM